MFANLLHIHCLVYARMREYMMGAVNSNQLKAKTRQRSAKSEN